MKTLQLLLLFLTLSSYCDLPTRYFLLEVDSGNARTLCEIYTNLTVKTPERLNDVILVSLMLTLNGFHALFCYFYYLP